MAAAPDTGDLSLGAAETSRAATQRHAYAPFSLVFASPAACWIMSGKARFAPRMDPIEAGWHVVTHADLDDEQEPRTAALLAGLRGWKPLTPEEAERGLWERLRGHGDGGVAGAPPTCIHEGTMRTVSTALVWLSRDRVRYLHAEGRPCETQPIDFTLLLADPASATEKP